MSKTPDTSASLIAAAPELLRNPAATADHLRQAFDTWVEGGAA